MQGKRIIRKTRSAVKGKITIAGNYINVTGLKKYGIPINDYFDEETGEKLTRYDYIKWIGEQTKEQLTEEDLLERKIYSQKKSLIRTQEKLHDLVNSNVGKWKEIPKFYTFTFRDEIEDLNEAHKCWNGFIRKFNYSITKQKNKSYLAYIAVPEIQYKRADKTGKKVWHYHVIMFNAPYVAQSKLLEMWGHGSVNVQGFMRERQFKKLEWDEDNKCFKFEDDSLLKNVGAYISKTIQYTAKEIDFREVGKDKKLYLSSKNLLKPFVSSMTDSEFKKLEEYIKSNDDIVVTTVKTYENEMGGVEYTKAVCKGRGVANDLKRFCEVNISLK